MCWLTFNMCLLSLPLTRLHLGSVQPSTKFKPPIARLYRDRPIQIPIDAFLRLSETFCLTATHPLIHNIQLYDFCSTLLNPFFPPSPFRLRCFVSVFICLVVIVSPSFPPLPGVQRQLSASFQKSSYQSRSPFFLTLPLFLFVNLPDCFLLLRRCLHSLLQARPSGWELPSVRPTWLPSL